MKMLKPSLKDVKEVVKMRKVHPERRSFPVPGREKYTVKMPKGEWNDADSHSSLR